MAKHSHWDNIKHKKAVNDKKKAAVIAKMGVLLTVAVQQGGPNLDDNPRLRLAWDKARASGMNLEAIERAIKKAAGEGKDGKILVEVTYEGYAPGGVAVVVQTLTDNRNRTAPEVKKIFERAGGAIGNPGCVAWQFKPKAAFLVGDETKGAKEETVMEVLLAAGCEPEDLAQVDRQVSVTADPRQFDAISKALSAAKLTVAQADFTKLPDTMVPVADPSPLNELLEALDDHDDVQEVFHNGELPDQA
ncbi:putative transcriptional regulatory protein [Planctomycetota bacterium]|nr:putative transcriptional regulatory protein [Planctomycetota bacterium]